MNDKFRVLVKHVTHPKNYSVSILNATEISDNAACYVIVCSGELGLPFVTT